MIAHVQYMYILALYMCMYVPAGPPRGEGGSLLDQGPPDLWQERGSSTARDRGLVVHVLYMYTNLSLNDVHVHVHVHVRVRTSYCTHTCT